MAKIIEKEKIFKKLIFVTILIIIIIFVIAENSVVKKNQTNKIAENTVKIDNQKDIENKEEIEETIRVPIQNSEKEPEQEAVENPTEEQIEKPTEKPVEKPIENPVKEPTSNPNNNQKFGKNVAFIGDSRTQAFLMYTGLKDVIDYTNIGLMVDTAVTKKFITNNKGQKITILEDLKTKNIDTIYIMLGVNELGWVYSSIFIKDYEELINKIKEIKPNCEIIIQSIIPVTKSKSDNDAVYNNRKISEYNALIKEMTNRKNIKYIDLVPTLADKNGNLPENASPDGIHLNKEYSVKWLECLRNS